LPVFRTATRFDKLTVLSKIEGRAVPATVHKMQKGIKGTGENVASELVSDEEDCRSVKLQLDPGNLWRRP
jgi:hypothetical protein